MENKTKEEVIKEAYGEYWDIAKPSENGWCNYDNITHEIHQKLEMESYNSFCSNTVRPKSLQGLDDNNGWIRIESENDLPKDEIDCHFVSLKYIYNGLWDNELKGFYCGLDKIKYVTHYQPIITPKPPLY